MNKDKVLHSSCKDLKCEVEVVDSAENQGRKIVSWFFYSICTFIIIFSYFLGEKSTSTFYAINAILWGVMSAGTFVKSNFFHKKVNLIAAVLEAIISVASIVTFIIISLR